MILEVNNIDTFYRVTQVIFGMSLVVHQGEVVCLLGRNGAAKTTTMRSIMGLTPPRVGSIKFKGKEIAGQRPHVITRQGIGYIHQDRKIFPDLTVRENLEIARQNPVPAGQGQTVERVYNLFPPLKDHDKHKGGHLSGGEQQMLAIGRTLMINPELLLLDEPAEGLSPVFVQILEEKIKQLKQEGMTMIMAEHSLEFAMRLSDRAYILERGRIQYDGTIETLRKNPEIIKKYLGV